MPVPKRKHSRKRIRTRQANKGIKMKAIASCQHCQKAIAPHQVCSECGYYKGVKIMVTKAERKTTRLEARANKKTASAEQDNTQQEA